ncbi:hypothetical protein [Mycolicibacterium sp.]|uniref:hypothetical protein n=1 Tax=Mycolicibacterium sp. TaxID=2320850 RepID=UPI0037C550B2
MRRAYIESHVPFDEAMEMALDWAGDTATIHAPDTAIIDENDLEDLGVPVTAVSSRSRLHGLARGTVIGAFLNLKEVLEVERSPHVDGLVVVPAHGPVRYAESVPSHAPWITAYDVERLGGEDIPRTPPASAPIKAAIAGLTGLAVTNQGLIDKRERSEVVHALTYLRAHGVELVPDAVMVEALRNEWGGTGPEDAHAIAVELNRGKHLKYDRTRLRPERLAEWARAT